MEIKNIRRRVLGEKASGNWDAVIQAPFGHLGIQTGVVDDSLMVLQICYLTKRVGTQSAKTKLGLEVAKQCQTYFKNPKFVFDLPLKPAGTRFQQSVWEQISRIPAGKTKTYGDVAALIRSAPRAVGQACGSNPYPLVVPCHRVIAATGIGGFAHHDGEGFHRQVKVWLLEHEGVKI